MKKLLAIMGIIALIGIVMLMAVQAQAMDVTLAWDANTEPDLGGYNIYWSPVQGVPVANRTKVAIPLSAPGFNPSLPEWTVPGLPNDKRIYFVATAYDSETPSLESEYSNEVYADAYTGRPPASPVMRLIRWILSLLWGPLQVKNVS